MNRDQLFVSCLFWYSFLLTSLTPLARLAYKQWLAISPLGALPAYASVAENPSQDKAFSLHALFALAWLVLSYTQICLVKNVRLHRIFGYLTLTALALHIGGSLVILYEDVEQHTLLNRTILFLSLSRTATNMVNSIRAAKNGNVALHRTLAVETFITSLDGAGTIRTVGMIQTLLGVGPVMCEVQYGHVGGHCDWTYTIRLCCVTLLSAVQIGVYRRFDAPFWQQMKTYIGQWAAVFAAYFMGLDQTDAFTVSLLLYAALWLMQTNSIPSFANCFDAKWNPMSQTKCAALP